MGTSNSWFPLTLSALAVATASGKLAQLVEEAWPKLKEASSPEILKAFRLIGALPALSSYADEEIWEAPEARRHAGTAQPAATGSLRAPEREVFTNPDPARNATDFRLKPVNPPRVCDRLLSQVVLVERLRRPRLRPPFSITGCWHAACPGNIYVWGR